MEVTLRITEGSNAGKELKIPGAKFLIGRGEDCHLRAKSDMISRHHCVIMIEENRVSVRDFGSRNGTFVNGEKISPDSELKHGDKLQVGSLNFEVQISTTQAALAKKRPKVKDVKDVAARTAETAAPGEGDVSDWLSEEEPLGSSRQVDDFADLKNLSETMLAEPAGALSSDSKAGTAAAEKEKDKSKPDTKIYGKLPTVPQQGHKNSRDAAADMLKKLFKTR